MNQIRDKVSARIIEKGPISFEEFMEIALYDKEHGYYSSSKENIGRMGDFYTSPYVHKAFGKTIAEFIIKSFDTLDVLKSRILELGAGKGTLAKDILDHIQAKHPDYYKHIEYYIVERSSSAAKEAGSYLKDHSGKFRILSSPDELIGGKITGVVISNEFFDALPFHRMKFSDNKLREIYVTLENGEFKDITGSPRSNGLEEYFNNLANQFVEGQEFEINLKAKNVLTKINSILSKGLLLTIDYGYLSEELFSPERMKGTYKCLYKHTINETPYLNTGSQDITAHVDFGNLIRAGSELGIKEIKYTTQGQFLLDWGILEILGNENGNLAEREIQSVKNLFMPGLMGDKFKVLIQGKNLEDGFKNFYPESPLKISFSVL